MVEIVCSGVRKSRRFLSNGARSAGRPITITKADEPCRVGFRDKDNTSRCGRRLLHCRIFDLAEVSCGAKRESPIFELMLASTSYGTCRRMRLQALS